jgi:hypothetical protein
MTHQRSATKINATMILTIGMLIFPPLSSELHAADAGVIGSAKVKTDDEEKRIRQQRTIDPRIEGTDDVGDNHRDRHETLRVLPGDVDLALARAVKVFF